MNGVRAKDVMTSGPVHVGPDTPAIEVAQLLTRRHISGVPVVDQDLRVLGVVSEADLLVKALPEDDVQPLLHLPSHRAHEQQRRFRGHTASEVMTSGAVTAQEDTPVGTLARTMLEHAINRIPIVREGKLVGIVTRNDLLKVFARSDAELLAQIQHFISDDLWIDPKRLRIRVEHGVVSIQGDVEEQAEAALIAAGARIEGVVDVDASRLRYSVDSRGRRLHP